MDSFITWYKTPQNSRPSGIFLYLRKEATTNIYSMDKLVHRGIGASSLAYATQAHIESVAGRREDGAGHATSALRGAPGRRKAGVARNRGMLRQALSAPAAFRKLSHACLKPPLAITPPMLRAYRQLSARWATPHGLLRAFCSNATTTYLRTHYHALPKTPVHSRTPSEN